MTFEQYVAIRDWMADMGLALSKGPENNEPLAALNKLHDALCDDMVFLYFNKAYKAICEARSDEYCDDQDRAEYGSPKDAYDKDIMKLEWYLRTRKLDVYEWVWPGLSEDEMEDLKNSCDNILEKGITVTFTPSTVVKEAEAYRDLGLNSELNLLLTRNGVKSIEELSLAEEAERKAQCRAELDKKMCGEYYDSDLADEAIKELF